jgi:hypothetical protein
MRPSDLRIARTLKLAVLRAELAAKPFEERRVRQRAPRSRRSKPDRDPDRLQLRRACLIAGEPLVRQETVHQVVDAVVFIAHGASARLAGSGPVITTNYDWVIHVTSRRS